MTGHDLKRERQTEQNAERQTSSAYISIRARLNEVRELELYRDKVAFKRTGILQPAKLYGRTPHRIDPAFDLAMQRLWDIGTLPEGRADTGLRRLYHLIAKGKAPLTETDVIKIAAMPDTQLRMLLPWLAHRLSLAEALDCVAKGEPAPPIIAEDI